LPTRPAPKPFKRELVALATRKDTVHFPYAAEGLDPKIAAYPVKDARDNRRALDAFLRR
jgi:hypothetical protein